MRHLRLQHRRRGPRRFAAALALSLCAAPVALVATPVAPATAAEGSDCLQTDDSPDPVSGTNTPYERLDIPEAHEELSRLGIAAGGGVDVVVVDSGMKVGALTQLRPDGYEGGTEVVTPHASVVAGIVNGPDQPADGADPAVPIGFAPAARVHSVWVYEAPATGEDASEEVQYPSASVLAEGLQAVAAQLRSGQLSARTVVVVPFVVARTGALRSALDAVIGAGGLVVATGGDRPAESAGSVLGDFAVSEGTLPPPADARGLAWPAAHPEVLAVGVDPVPWGAEANGSFLPNSDIDIAAPAGDGVSRGLDGRACWLEAPSSDWAAAEVGGVAALVWSRFPTADASAIRQRLLRTADGNVTTNSPFTGQGVVQPVAALERRAGAWTEDAGASSTEAAQRAPAPRKPADVLAETRSEAVWWGLVCGGLLVVALTLRPVLARRRR
ncbi:type VII secretion-associated serine protease mycosin [Nocardioides sambongensis]|uniref:hypothetical protein n=1 Tax=Nocardioides sambongensis TaxID=2589074 RepID=UPI0015E83CE5|nr:hypothetical protein [Nocardioides sambongensis]